MAKPITVTLTLTEEEVNLITRSLATEVLDQKEQIKLYSEHLRSDFFATWAAEAKVKIPMLEALHSKISRAMMDAKFPLLGGQTE